MIKNRPLSKRIRFKERMYRNRYILPNLVTVGNMFCGFLAIFYSFSGNFTKAILAIIFAIVFDGLDGRTARKLNACTQFGFEFDSLSDLVSFGLAPAILCYNWAMVMHFKEFGVFISFIYVVCAAGRLARFNCTEENLKSFQGLPSPAGALALISMVYAFRKVEPTYVWAVVASIVVCYVAFLMVSNYKFLSIKLLKMSKLRMYGRIFIAIFLGLLWCYPKEGFILISVVYCASGPIITYMEKRKEKREIIENKSEA